MRPLALPPARISATTPSSGSPLAFLLADSASDKLDALLAAAQDFNGRKKADEAVAAEKAEKAKKAEFEAKLAAGKGMQLTKEQAQDRKAQLLAVSRLDF